MFRHIYDPKDYTKAEARPACRVKKQLVPVGAEYGDDAEL